MGATYRTSSYYVNFVDLGLSSYFGGYFRLKIEMCVGEGRGVKSWKSLWTGQLHLSTLPKFLVEIQAGVNNEA